MYAAKLGKGIATVPERMMTALCNYPWPGNIRELQHVIERAVILTQGTELALDNGFHQVTASPTPPGLLPWRRSSGRISSRPWKRPPGASVVSGGRPSCSACRPRPSAPACRSLGSSRGDKSYDISSRQGLMPDDSKALSTLGAGISEIHRLVGLGVEIEGHSTRRAPDP
jgi:hypothetical protein